MFSETAQRILANPTHIGPLESYTQQGVAGVAGEGPYMQIWLEVACGRTEDGAAAEVIETAAYKTFGCPSATVCGSMVCRLLTGMDAEKARLLTSADLIRILGGLPEGKEYCADLAIQAVADALSREDGRW